jgi:hypothetical protein
MEYHIVKRVFTPPGKVMMLFMDVPQACWRRWWRDGFPTRVPGARGVLVPTAMSHRGWCFRPTLLKTPKGAIFISIREPSGMQKPGLPFWVVWLGGLVTESRPLALNHKVVKRRRGLKDQRRWPKGWMGVNQNSSSEHDLYPKTDSIRLSSNPIKTT